LKKVFGMLLIAVAMNAFAGEKGNGGDAVVCRDASRSIISAELLDYYEGRTLRNLNVPEFQGSDIELFQKLETTLSKMDKDTFTWFSDALWLLTHMENHLKGTDVEVPNPTVIYTTDPLTDIPDSGELILKEGCKVEQLVIHTNTDFPEDPEFIIQENILKKLDQKNLRGLAIHELLYKSMIKRGERLNYEVKNSIPTRYLHQKLMSNILTFSSYSYANVLIASCGKTCPADALSPNGIAINGATLQKRDGSDGQPLVRARVTAGNQIVILKNDAFEIDLDRTRKFGATFIAGAWFCALDTCMSSFADAKISLVNESTGEVWSGLISYQNIKKVYKEMTLGIWKITIDIGKLDQKIEMGLDIFGWPVVKPLMASNKPQTLTFKIKVTVDRKFKMHAEFVP
jgi:hypothetical protein